MKKILLVEDSQTIILGLKYSLEQENFEVVVANDICQAITSLKDNNVDLAVLDISLPDGDGFELCKKIKNIKDIPIIFLTAKDEENDIILGLEIGADDYITKPFRVRELISRINTVLRRYNKDKTEENENLIQLKNIVINTTSAQVLKNGQEIVFTSLEYKILVLLFSNPNKLITREFILDRIWDIAGNFVNDNTLTVYIKRIREKLNDTKEDEEIIKTVRGLGYKVENDDIKK